MEQECAVHCRTCIASDVYTCTWHPLCSVLATVCGAIVVAATVCGYGECGERTLPVLSGNCTPGAGGLHAAGATTELVLAMQRTYFSAGNVDVF